MNEALALAIFRTFEERIRRKGVRSAAEREEIAADALANFFIQNPESFYTVATSSPIVLLVLRLSKLPEKKALSQHFAEQKRRARWEQTLDFSVPANDRFYSAPESASPALLAERRDELDAIRRYANELGDYRGVSRFALALAQMEGGESFSALARRLGVTVDALRRVNRKTLQHVRIRRLTRTPTNSNAD